VSDPDRIISAYRRAYPSLNPFKLLCTMINDRGFPPDSIVTPKNAITLSERKAALHKAPVYMYVLAWESPALSGKLGAVHGTDVTLVFHNLGAMTGTGPEALALADRMAGAWVAFARTGNPNHRGIPEWPAYTPETHATMIFDNQCRIENDPGGELRALWPES
jgi:para-nitrobenzyl esterase